MWGPQQLWRFPNTPGSTLQYQWEWETIARKMFAVYADLQALNDKTTRKYALTIVVPLDGV
jgi:hypothetical protein